MGKWSAGTFAHDDGIPVCVGPGVAEGSIPVLRVVGCTVIVELGVGALLDTGGVSLMRFSETNLSKSTFWPRDRSSL